MIESVTVINHLGKAILLELANPASSGFEVRDIQGIGPVKASIHTSKVATVDGVMYNSATVDGRNITMRLGFLAQPTIEETRHKAYSYFPLKKKVTLVFKTDIRTLATYGYVESNEPTIWGQEKETFISIVCPDAYFFDASSTPTVGAEFFATSGLFEFPFSNESTTEKLLEFGRIESITDRIITYPGDTEVGVTIEIDAIGNVTTPVIYDPNTNEAIRIDSTILIAMTGSNIVDGDNIVITTGKGEKSATLTRNGIKTNILNALGRNVGWIQLEKGANRFTYSATSGAANLRISITGPILYEGV